MCSCSCNIMVQVSSPAASTRAMGLALFKVLCPISARLTEEIQYPLNIGNKLYLLANHHSVAGPIEGSTVEICCILTFKSLYSLRVVTVRSVVISSSNSFLRSPSSGGNFSNILCKLCLKWNLVSKNFLYPIKISSSLITYEVCWVEFGFRIIGDILKHGI